MQTTHRLFIYGLAMVLATAVAGCNDDGDTMEPPPAPAELGFSQTSLDLQEERFGSITLTNSGEVSAGPIVLEATAVTQTGGVELPGASLQIVPNQISSLDGGASVTISLSLTVPNDAPGGDYTVEVEALIDGELAASLGVSFVVIEAPPSGTVASLTISEGADTVRQGEVEAYGVIALDENGDTITAPNLVWSLDPASAGLITETGRFVGYTPGDAKVVASEGSVADSLDVTIEARNGLNGSFSVVGQGETTDRYTSDLWVHGNFAYTGTWGTRNGNPGNQMRVWDISNPSSPQLLGNVTVSAGTVNDVKVRADGQIAVITHEGSPPNGITLLSLADPAAPTVITRFSSELEAGVHNVWIEGDFVYVVVDGSQGLRIVDISTPSSPFIAARVSPNTSFLHDVYVRDGLAFLSQWDDGLVILDVGAGVAGGSPANPQEVGRVITAFGNTHNAWYWPATGYVFVGEESGRPGTVHIVDARDLSQPKEVGTITVPGDTPHNFWLDEANAVLYIAWYSNGLRAFDVSGELLGELDRQDREIAFSDYGTGIGGCPGGPTNTCSWAPQLHDGLVYVADMHTGLWVFQPNF